MKHREVTLDDKYDRVKGHAWMTGIQALVRLPLDQKRLDVHAGHTTAGFISGYRGSPLGGLDQSLRAIQGRLDAHDVKFWEGLNEDLGATAVWGSQQLGLFPGARYDGVFGMWYGKAPGVDRSGDAIKHANFAGSSRLGGVLAVAGDDPMCKSSTLPSQSDFAFADFEIPVLNPASIQDVLDFGIHGWAMSRFSGAWAGLLALADTMDSGAVVNVDLDRFDLRLPEIERPEDGVHLRRGDQPLDKEIRLRRFKLPAAQAYVRANGLDQRLFGRDDARLGVIVTGQAARDVYEALAAIGLTPERAAELGMAVWKVALTWPLEPHGIRDFCAGLDRVLVLEHKRALIEDQLKSVLYDLPDGKRPRIEGKRDLEGRPLLPDTGIIPVPEMARALAERLGLTAEEQARADAYFARISQAKAVMLGNSAAMVRRPHFCSGCPHNTSTNVPEGSRALAGIGCHYMTLFLPERNTDMVSHMGGEGIGWVGQHAFTDEAHVFVNLGDGTYSHSGLLAIRAALTSGANMTYKILYNDAVAMTGGQSVESGQTVDQIARQVEAEGVKTIAIVTEDVTRYASMKGLPANAKVYDRSRLEEVQEALREEKGVSVIIYDQICATEKRRRIKRRKMEDKNIRVLINADVCEGCGDCSAKSNCLSVEPLETELGRKRMINQSTCNTDLSCVNGFCPSFVTVQGAEPAWAKKERPAIDAGSLPLPTPPAIEGVHNIMFSGVGGTGVTTVAAILAMGAHVDGNASTSLDMTGLAQKGGPVLSHVRLAHEPEDISTGRVPPASAHVFIACDLVVAAAPDALGLMAPDVTMAVGNTDITPTSDFIRDRSTRFESDLLSARITRRVKDFDAIDAEALAVGYLHDAIYTNMIMLGFAWQKGLVPVSLRGLYRAIKLNGTKVEDNLTAFDIGRIMAHDPSRLPGWEKPRTPPAERPLDELVDHRAGLLVAYQNEAYAQRYRDLVARVRERETAAGLGEDLTRAVAKYAYKLMAYKDEYEVARLFTNGDFEARLKENFTGKYRMRFHLAPPILARKDKHGHLTKKRFGAWMLPAFRLLAKLKGLRGTRLDLFGYTAERRMERALRDDYMALAERLSGELTASNHALAVEIASLPDEIRGYGHVKDAAVEAAKAREAELLSGWPEGRAPGRTSLIDAA